MAISCWQNATIGVKRCQLRRVFFTFNFHQQVFLKYLMHLHDQVQKVFWGIRKKRFRNFCTFRIYLCLFREFGIKHSNCLKYYFIFENDRNFAIFQDSGIKYYSTHIAKLRQTRNAELSGQIGLLMIRKNNYTWILEYFLFIATTSFLFHLFLVFFFFLIKCFYIQLLLYSQI